MDSFKCIILGQVSVGKTAIFVRSQKGIYDEHSLQATVSASFATMRIKLNNDLEVKLQLWDTSSAEKF